MATLSYIKEQLGGENLSDIRERPGRQARLPDINATLSDTNDEFVINDVGQMESYSGTEHQVDEQVRESIVVPFVRSVEIDIIEHRPGSTVHFEKSLQRVRV